MSEEKLCPLDKPKCQGYKWSFCDSLTLSKTAFKSTLKDSTVGKKRQWEIINSFESAQPMLAMKLVIICHLNYFYYICINYCMQRD